MDCPPVDTAIEVVDQPFDAESVDDSEDADLVPLQSGEDWVAQLDDDLSRPTSQSGENFRITALQLQDSTCITHASLFGGHLGRSRTLARLSQRFYWSGMSDDVKDWLGQCTVCMKSYMMSRPSIVNFRWDRGCYAITLRRLNVN